jgi:LPS-assembly protein
MRLLWRLCACVLCAQLFAADAASAQQAATPLEGTTSSRRREVVNGKDWHFVGAVEMEMRDTKLYADEVWYYADEHRAVAAGNVVFTQGNNRIAADRAEMDTDTRLGTFYNAWGIANVQRLRSAAPAGGIAVPALTGQDNDVYFFGETIEKTGPKKYRITNGGFTTCVQPSPRWDLHAGTVDLNIDHYTLLRNAVLNVKGVPMFYLPFLYYPTKEDGRATGFLLPTYGASSGRGQTISNAFFWAINRSQDATIMHDWFSRAGQGWGTEYRYATFGGDGSVRGYLLDQRNYTINGSPQPATRSFDIRGGANQQLPLNLRARARVDYFSRLETRRTFDTDVNLASTNNRTIGGNLLGAWRGYSLNATFDRSEYFSGGTTSTVTGNAPRISFTRNERPIGRNAPLYVSVGSEFVHFERESRSDDVATDSGLARFDFTPQIRYPFKRWQWFTVNSTAAWRSTYYTRSLQPDAVSGALTLGDDDLSREYFTLTAQAVGPVFNRIWDTPGNGYAERFKHTIEPFFTVQRTSAIDEFSRIVRTDGTDSIIGNATNLGYGLNNRIYAKRRIGQASQAQEIVNVELRQTYYSDQSSAQFDQQYTTTYNTAAPSHFSPVSLTVRATPSTGLNATFRAEFDSRHRELRTTSVSGSYNWASRIQTSLGWSHKYFIEGERGHDNPDLLDHYVNVDTRVRTLDNRVGTNYSFNYDVLRSTLRQQRVSAFYNAQCCGIAFEYQRYRFGVFAAQADNRFFMSFTLAGLGNFSPFSGALANIPR